eukprot:COSAG01_NODE_7399_length_3222_cov_3.645853_1_plen_54_part_10
MKTRAGAHHCSGDGGSRKEEHGRMYIRYAAAKHSVALALFCARGAAAHGGGAAA